MAEFEFILVVQRLSSGAQMIVPKLFVLVRGDLLKKLRRLIDVTDTTTIYNRFLI